MGDGMDPKHGPYGARRRDDLGERIENYSLYLVQKNEMQAQIAALTAALREIKGRVCGDATPNWAGVLSTVKSRSWIADRCDAALSPHTAEMVAVKRERLERWLTDAEDVGDAVFAQELRALLEGGKQSHG